MESLSPGGEDDPSLMGEAPPLPWGKDLPVEETGTGAWRGERKGVSFSDKDLGSRVITPHTTRGQVCGKLRVPSGESIPSWLTKELGACWTLALIPALRFPSCVAKATYSICLSLSFLVCKMGMIIVVPPSYVYCTEK